MICSAGDLLLAISGQRTGLWSFIRGILLLDSSEVCGEIIRDVFLVNTGPRLYLPTCASKLACKLLQAKANAPLIIVHPSSGSGRTRAGMWEKESKWIGKARKERQGMWDYDKFATSQLVN